MTIFEDRAEDLLSIITFIAYILSLAHKVNHKCFGSIPNLNHKTCFEKSLVERRKCFEKGFNFNLTNKFFI